MFLNGCGDFDECEVFVEYRREIPYKCLFVIFKTRPGLL